MKKYNELLSDNWKRIGKYFGYILLAKEKERILFNEEDDKIVTQFLSTVSRT